MSLQNLANQMQSTGRGGDTMLVHMSPREVAGLQQLAVAHGGSLTTNPETGLPEAGFLSSILPMVISAVATANGIPISPAQMGMASAAVSLAQGKGIMGAVSNGMQAYSGANLAQGVMGAAPVPGYQIGPEGVANIGNQSFAPPPEAPSIVPPPAPPSVNSGMSSSYAPQTVGMPTGGSSYGPNLMPPPIQAPITTLTPPNADVAGLRASEVAALQGKNPVSVQNAVDTSRMQVDAGRDLAENRALRPNPQGLSEESRRFLVTDQKPVPETISLKSDAPSPLVNRPTEVVSARTPYGGYGEGPDYMDVAHSTGPSGVSPTDVADRSISSPSGKFSSGLKAIFNDEAARDKFLSENKGSLITAGLSALMTPQEEKKRKAAAASVPLDAYRYNPTYSPSPRYAGGTSERTYFAADGGMVPGPQQGGTVEQMSQMNANAVGGNMRYPMASQTTPTYAMPAERPISQNVIYPATDEPVDPYTGMPTTKMMAGGGIVALKKGGKPKAPAAPKTEAQINEENAAREFAEFLKSRNEEKNNAIKEYDARKNDITKDYTQRIADFNRDTSSELSNKQKDMYLNEYNELKKDAKSRAQKAELSNWLRGREKEYNEWKSGYQKERATELQEIQNNQKNDLANWQQERNAGVGDIERDIKERQSLRDFDSSVFKSGYTGFNSNIEGDDFTGITKGYDTEIGKQKSEADKAKAAFEQAKKTGIQSLIDRAQDMYNQQQGEYEEANKAKEGRLNQFREETKRTTSGLTARGEYTSDPVVGNNVESLKAQIERIKANPEQQGYMGGEGSLSQAQQKEVEALEGQIKAVTAAKQVYNPKTGQYEADKTKTFKSLTKAPGYGTTKKIMEEEDVRQIFEELTGRTPTQREMATYLGKNLSQTDLVNALVGTKKTSGLAELSAARTFSDEDLNAQAKYYWGRDMTKGELAYFKDPANKLTNFNSLRNAMVNNQSYLQNLNKVNQAAFNKTVEADRVAAEGPVTQEQVSSAYKDLFGKPPTAEQLQAALSSGASISQLTAQLKSSPEYATKMTQPLVPEVKQGAVPAINTIATPPVTPISQAQIDAYRQGYNAPATGGQSTAQLNLGPLFGSTGQGGYVFNQPQQQASIEGALPYQDVINRLGIGGVYQQIANKAPELQAGVQFNVPQHYTPIGQPTKPFGMAAGGMAGGGYNLGGYSDGGRLLKGPGDGVSDSIPASIGNRQPARLADGEFVIPARIVSELGNGSTEAGARKLYDMMARVQRARKRTMGKGKVAVNSRADKMLPA